MYDRIPVKGHIISPSSRCPVHLKPVSLFPAAWTQRHGGRRYWKKITFQFGASVDDSYLAVSGRSGLDWALSTGMSFPLRNSTAFYWSLRFKRNSYTYPTRNTVTENMLTLTLGVSFGETWFVRRKFE